MGRSLNPVISGPRHEPVEFVPLPEEALPEQVVAPPQAQQNQQRVQQAAAQSLAQNKSRERLFRFAQAVVTIMSIASLALSISDLQEAKQRIQSCPQDSSQEIKDGLTNTFNGRIFLVTFGSLDLAFKLLQNYRCKPRTSAYFHCFSCITAFRMFIPFLGRVPFMVVAPITDMLSIVYNIHKAESLAPKVFKGSCKVRC